MRFNNGGFDDETHFFKSGHEKELELEVRLLPFESSGIKHFWSADIVIGSSFFSSSSLFCNILASFCHCLFSPPHGHAFSCFFPICG